MFGVFKKKNSQHNADNEIDLTALKVVEESVTFAAIVVGKLPIDYDEKLLLSFLEERIANSDSETYDEYVKKSKIGYEFACFILEIVSRNYNSQEHRKIGDYIWNRMGNIIQDKYVGIYKSFVDGKSHEIRSLLTDLLNDRSVENAKYKLIFGEAGNLGNSVAWAVAKRIQNIRDATEENLEEQMRILIHLTKISLSDRIEQSLKIMKVKLVKEGLNK